MKNRISRFVLASALLAGAVGPFTGCQPKGPAEKAGRAVDRAAQDVRDKVDPAGPVEKAGRAVDRTVNP